MVKKKNTDILQLDIIRICRTTFFVILLIMAVTAIFDAGNLITRELVVKRWIAASFLLFITVSVWFAIHTKSSAARNTLLMLLLSVSEVIFAGFMIYWERGMAATSTLLLVLPIITVGVLRNRVLLLFITTLTATAYALVAVKYFNDFFNEGYRVQLWGNVLLYSGLCFIVAWMVMVITNLRHDPR